MAALPESAGLVIGRYVLYDEIAAGGMATVHFGKLLGAAGFARTVAIKRLHAQHARDADFTTMFLDEARLAARIRHPNVVAVLDVLHQQGELFLVMDYVQGESFSRLMRAVRPSIVPTRIALSIMTGVLNGLHAAHEATTESGEPLSIVHRDVSPQNIMVGTDGVARVLDFGVAKAANRAQTTREGTVKGKLSYMAPEQLLTEAVDRRADVYAAAVVLWEALTGERLFEGDNQGRVVRKILDEPVPTPSSRVPGFTKALDDAVMRGLERDVTKRFATAREFATALERCMPMATSTEIGEWVESIGGSALGERAKRVKEIESRSDIQPPISQARTVSNYPTRTDLEKPEAKAVRETVPQAFAVMATPMDLKQPTDPDISPPSSGHASGTQKADSRRIVTASPFSPMPVQTLAVRPTPLAQLDPIPVPVVVMPTPEKAFESIPPPAPKRRTGRVVLVLFVLLAIAGAVVTWLRLRGRL